MQIPDGTSSIARDALEIWRAGVAAVQAEQLVRREVRLDGWRLEIADQEWKLDPQGELIVVGAGKATFKMLQGLLTVLDQSLPDLRRRGWVNVPERTVDQSLDPRIHVSQARPLGLNEPTPKVIDGTKAMMKLIAEATPRDTVICLLTGGGSALLSAPSDGLSLADKIAVTRWLSQCGASIEELNQVRRSISLVKGGGLVRGCRARNWITLIISDVLGDPLEYIASGPTVIDKPVDFLTVKRILERFDPDRQGIPPAVYRAVEQRLELPAAPTKGNASGVIPSNIILANNATAVDAAGSEAVRRGYAYWMESSRRSEGAAEEVGRQLARQWMGLADFPSIQCLITGGEPSVVLPPAATRGRGGRNQQLALAAIDEILIRETPEHLLARLAFVSGGTDGEDGPTDAAGAWFDASVLATARRLNLQPRDYLKRCDAYHFFQQTKSLILTGPTHTNVCDLRVAIMKPSHGS